MKIKENCCGVKSMRVFINFCGTELKMERLKNHFNYQNKLKSKNCMRLKHKIPLYTRKRSKLC